MNTITPSYAKPPRKGYIRYAIIGAIGGILFFPAVRLFCEWVVAGAKILEGMNL